MMRRHRSAPSLKASADRAARAAAALLIAGAVAKAGAAAANWTPGNPAIEGTHVGIADALDINGDGVTDFVLNAVGTGYGGLPYFCPETVDGFNDQIYSSYGMIVRFEAPDEILDDSRNSDGCADVGYDFQGNPGYMGMIFRIPGSAAPIQKGSAPAQGTQNYGYLRIQWLLSGGIEITGSGYQPMPSVPVQPVSWSRIKALY